MEFQLCGVRSCHPSVIAALDTDDNAEYRNSTREARGTRLLLPDTGLSHRSRAGGEPQRASRRRHPRMAGARPRRNFPVECENRKNNPAIRVAGQASCWSIGLAGAPPSMSLTSCGRVPATPHRAPCRVGCRGPRPGTAARDSRVPAAMHPCDGRAGTHRALKEAAARQNRSMASIIEESLELRGIRPYETAREIVARARASSGLSADDAMAWAVEETRRFREGR